MHLYIESLTKRIQKLENSLEDIREELKTIPLRPPIHVDTIHYSFDQLKVETLEGTLNIGLNPSDLEAIEDMDIEQNVNAKTSEPKEQMELSMAIEDSVLNFLDEELKQIVDKYAKELNIETSEKDVDFIRQDIERQLHPRIDYYLNQSKMKNLSTEQQKIQIEQKLIHDIEKAVRTFLEKYHLGKKE